MSRIRLEDGRTPVVVGPHWIVCAQAAAALGARLPEPLPHQAALRVGCHSEQSADFAKWLPPSAWHDASSLVFVQDDRFPVDTDQEFPNYAPRQITRVPLWRGGRLVRTVRFTWLHRSRRDAQREPPEFPRESRRDR